MEAENQNPPDPVDVAEEAKEDQTKSEEIPSTNTADRKRENQDEEQQEAGTSSEVTVAEQKKPPGKRNYRRRTEADEDSSTSDSSMDVEPVATAEAAASSADAAGDAAEAAGDSGDDVSLDGLRASDNGRNSSARSTDSDGTDSSFSFGSPLSPLLRFGIGNRQVFERADSGSNVSSDEEIVDKSRQLTREILAKLPPPHNSLTWPKLLQNRESGYYCKRNESRYANHRKVFEKNFYGSLNSVQRLELMAKLNEHFGCVNCLGFSKNGRYLLSGSDDLRVILWDWYNNKALTQAVSKHRKNIFQVKFYEESSSHMKVVSASADGTISLHQFTGDGGHTEKQVYKHAGAVHKLAVTENAIYTCGEDGLIIEFDQRTKKPVKMVTVREKHRKIPLFSISTHPYEMKYAVSGRDQFVRVYDRRNHKTVWSRHCPTELLKKNTTVRYISCCVYNYNGTELLSSFNDENVYLFDANNQSLGSYLHKYQGHVNSSTIKGVNFYGPKSEFIVSGSDCSNIFFWEKETEAIVQWVRGDENGIVNVLEPHPIYPVLATSGLDKDIKIWIASNDEFSLDRESLERCVLDNMRNQLESGQAATFTLDPAIIQLARRFFQRHNRESTSSPDPLSYVYHSSNEDSSSSS